MCVMRRSSRSKWVKEEVCVSKKIPYFQRWFWRIFKVKGYHWIGAKNDRSIIVLCVDCVSFVQTVVKMYLFWTKMILMPLDGSKTSHILVPHSQCLFWPTKIQFWEWKMKNRFWFYESHKCARFQFRQIGIHQTSMMAGNKALAVMGSIFNTLFSLLQL